MAAKRVKSSPSKAQSSMEYLMTYGWAILIIAIGVATLSALGIFNGGSGSTNGCSTQPNFSCTNPIYSTNGIIATISQDSGQEYYDSWVFVASAAQELGGNGLPQNMSTANMVNTGELPSSQPETFYFVSNTETTAGGIPTTNIPVGTQFTGSIWLAYCTVPGCSSPTGYAKVGGVSTKEEGTNAGYSSGSSTSITSTSSTSSTSTSTTSIQYVPITLTNTQSSATGSDFQQMVSASTSYTANGEAANLKNVEFTTGPAAAGAPLYAWCESGCTSSSTSVWWVNLSTDTMSAAPGPGNSITIYMNFMPTPIMTSNTAYTGEAPQLYGGAYAQGSYAQYDNGAEVFPYYQRFGGLSGAPTNWGYQGGDSSPGITYGAIYTTLSQVSTGWGVYADSSPPSSATSFPSILEMYGNMYNTGAGISYGLVSMPFGGNNGAGQTYSFEVEGANAQTYVNYGHNGGTITSSNTDTNTNKMYSVLIPSATSTSGLINYGTAISMQTVSSYSSTDFGFGIEYNVGSMVVYYVRTRAYPPNGFMPSVSFGSVV